MQICVVLKRKNDDKIPQHHHDASCGKSTLVGGSLRDLNPLPYVYTSDKGTSVSLKIQLSVAVDCVEVYLVSSIFLILLILLHVFLPKNRELTNKPGANMCSLEKEK